MALEDLMEFPCEYRIKVLGGSEPDFPALVHAAVAEHAGESAQTPDVRPSKKGNFVSVNITFTASSVPQLEAIHQSLTDTGRVKYIL